MPTTPAPNHVATAFGLILSHIPVLLALLALILGLTRSPPQNLGASYNVLRFFLLCSIGLQGIWVFIGHAFFASQVSKSIGWAPSPFEYEIAMTNLGLGVIGLVAFFHQRKDFWLCTVLMSSCFSYRRGIRSYLSNHHQP